MINFHNRLRALNFKTQLSVTVEAGAVRNHDESLNNNKKSKKKGVLKTLNKILKQGFYFFFFFA